MSKRQRTLAGDIVINIMNHWWNEAENSVKYGVITVKY